MNDKAVPEIKIPELDRRWAKCPFCGMKVVVYDNTANCRGVWLKCTRGCKKVFELVLEKGQQT